MSPEERSIDCAVTWRHDWTPHLFSFRTVRPPNLAFAPGQFVRIGLPKADATMVWRAYSIASAPTADFLEFYSIVVPDGPLTQPLARIAVGDSIRVDPTVYGFLRVDRFVGGTSLWLLATGTGIAPYLSILSDAAVWRRFRDIVVVHGVRHRADLAYREQFEAWAAKPVADARLIYLPTMTADDDTSIAQGRLTSLLADGVLERTVGLDLSTAASRLMICGNPSMIKDTRALLAARGMTPVRRDSPGQYIAENFW